MAAATRDQRHAQRLPGVGDHSYGYPPKSGVCIFKRAIVAVNAAFQALPAATAANIGAVVYAVDDATLSLDGTGGKLKVGTIDAIDAEGVWVRI